MKFAEQDIKFNNKHTINHQNYQNENEILLVWQNNAPYL